MSMKAKKGEKNRKFRHKRPNQQQNTQAIYKLLQSITGDDAFNLNNDKWTKM